MFPLPNRVYKNDPVLPEIQSCPVPAIPRQGNSSRDRTGARNILP
ncbi:MAG: hypothetical protein ACP5M0_03340 [Desulfomonilaceae bacterium]